MNTDEEDTTAAETTEAGTHRPGGTTGDSTNDDVNTDMNGSVKTP